METVFVAKSLPSLHAALRTQGRRWNQLLLSCKDRRNLFVKLQITVGDLEGGFTPGIDAGLLHDSIVAANFGSRGS